MTKSHSGCCLPSQESSDGGSTLAVVTMHAIHYVDTSKRWADLSCLVYLGPYSAPIKLCLYNLNIGAWSGIIAATLLLPLGRATA